MKKWLYTAVGRLLWGSFRQGTTVYNSYNSYKVSEQPWLFLLTTLIDPLAFTPSQFGQILDKLYRRQPLPKTTRTIFETACTHKIRQHVPLSLCFYVVSSYLQVKTILTPSTFQFVCVLCELAFCVCMLA